MKNTVYQGLAFLAMMLSLAACQKSDPASNETGENGASVSKKRISITATIPETITKVAMTQEDNGSGKPTGPVSLAWETGDKITISNGPDTEVFELTSIEGTKAVFEGNEITGSSFTITYSKLPDFKSQSQPENASTKGLGWEGKLSGVNAITDFTFSSDWATAHGGGTFTQSSILRLRAKLPSGVASTVNGVTIKAFDVATGAKVNLIDDDIPQIAVTIAEPGAGAETDVVTVYATMPAEDITVPSGKALLFSFSSTNSNHSVYTHYRPVTSPITIAQGTVTPLNINCPEVATYANANNTDIGTASNPYLIGDAYQLDAVHEELERAQTKYFKLIDDIDFNNTGVVWFPINNGYDRDGTGLSGNSFDKAIDFNGNSKTISNLTTKKSPDDSEKYAGLFGVLMGNVYNLTIDKATIYPKGKSGVLAGWLGTGSYGPDHCEVKDIVITNSKVENGGDYVGIIAAHSNKANNIISNIRIDNCTVSTAGYASGLIAYFQQAAVVRDVEVTETKVSSTGHSNANTPVVNDGLAGGISARVNAIVDFDRCSFNGTVLGPTLTSGNTNSTQNRFVGGFAGYVDNVAATFDDCKVISTTVGLVSAPGTNNNRYVGGAFGYLGSAAKVGETTACSVENLSMNGNIRNYIAGFVSYLDGATIKNSTASGTIGNGQNTGAAGGFVGYCVGGTLYNNSTSVNINGAGNPGGFVGWNETTPTTFEKCNATGDVSASGNNAGGFAGIVKIGSTFTECHSIGKVTSSAGYVGGFAGNINANDVTISKCYSKSTVEATGNYVGGLVGVCQNDLIEKSFYNGSVKGASRVGGILGISLKDNAVTIKNCYSRGTLTGGTGEQRFGGIVGDLGKGGSVSNCWSDIKIVDAGRVIGGIVGLACYQAWGDATVSNNAISSCIAWNPSVEAIQSGNYGSSGAIVGHTSFKNTLSDCYRLSSMSYKNSYNCSGGEWNTTMVDQPNCDGTNWSKGTTPGTKSSYTYQQPYNGKAADASATVTTVARDILGWPNTIWSFNGDFPTLIGVN